MQQHAQEQGTVIFGFQIHFKSIFGGTFWNFIENRITLICDKSLLINV
jgi:hypothetical protein